MKRILVITQQMNQGKDLIDIVDSSNIHIGQVVEDVLKKNGVYPNWQEMSQQELVYTDLTRNDIAANVLNVNDVLATIPAYLLVEMTDDKLYITGPFRESGQAVGFHAYAAVERGDDDPRWNVVAVNYDPNKGLSQHVRIIDETVVPYLDELDVYLSEHADTDGDSATGETVELTPVRPDEGE